MPYIQKKDRNCLDPYHDDNFSPCIPATAGELNFVITKAVLAFLRTRTKEGAAYRYSDLNEAIGALECAKQELYRRVVSKIEDDKREENGDVY